MGRSVFILGLPSWSTDGSRGAEAQSRKCHLNALQGDVNAVSSKGRLSFTSENHCSHVNNTDFSEDIGDHRYLWSETLWVFPLNWAILWLIVFSCNRNKNQCIPCSILSWRFFIWVFSFRLWFTSNKTCYFGLVMLPWHKKTIEMNFTSAFLYFYGCLMSLLTWLQLLSRLYLN